MKFMYRIGIIAAVYMLIMGAGNVTLASVNPEAVQAVIPGGCTEYDVAKAFFEKAGASRVWTGLAKDGGGAAVIYVSEYQWWLVIIRAADGYTCMKLNGDDHWMLIPPAIEGDDS